MDYGFEKMLTAPMHARVGHGENDVLRKSSLVGFDGGSTAAAAAISFRKRKINDTNDATGHYNRRAFTTVEWGEYATEG